MDEQYSLGDIVLGNWTLTRLIGERSFGRVFEAEREDFGHTYRSTIKIITIYYYKLVQYTERKKTRRWSYAAQAAAHWG